MVEIILDSAYTSIERVEIMRFLGQYFDVKEDEWTRALILKERKEDG